MPHLATFIFVNCVYVIASIAYIRSSNPRPLDREPSALTTRPWLWPQTIYLWLYWLTVRLSECLCVYLTICLSNCLFDCLWICTSVCVFDCLSDKLKKVIDSRSFGCLTEFVVNVCKDNFPNNASHSKDKQTTQPFITNALRPK